MQTLLTNSLQLYSLNYLLYGDNIVFFLSLFSFFLFLTFNGHWLISFWWASLYVCFRCNGFSFWWWVCTTLRNLQCHKPRQLPACPFTYPPFTYRFIAPPIPILFSPSLIFPSFPPFSFHLPFSSPNASRWSVGAVWAPQQSHKEPQPQTHLSEEQYQYLNTVTERKNYCNVY